MCLQTAQKQIFRLIFIGEQFNSMWLLVLTEVMKVYLLTYLYVLPNTSCTKIKFHSMYIYERTLKTKFYRALPTYFISSWSVRYLVLLA